MGALNPLRAGVAPYAYRQYTVDLALRPDVKASDGRVLATFRCHGQAFRALAVAGGSGAYGDWVASMSPEDLKKAGRLNSYLASQPEYKA